MARPRAPGSRARANDPPPPVAVGGVALGALAFGGLTVGAIALGGLAVAEHVIAAPPTASRLPLAAIPHPPFRWTDAAVLIVAASAALALARAVQSRRQS